MKTIQKPTVQKPKNILRWNAGDEKTLIALYNKGNTYKKISKSLSKTRSSAAVTQKIFKLLQSGAIQKRTRKYTKPSANIIPFSPGAAELIKELHKTKPNQVVITVGKVEITAVY